MNRGRRLLVVLSPTIPESPLISTVTTTATDQPLTTTAPTAASTRSRRAESINVALALAYPPAAKNTGIGATTVRNASPGRNSSRLAPRTSPSGRSMTASTRWPATTIASASTRATSIASRRPDVWVLDDAATAATVRDHASPRNHGSAPRCHRDVRPCHHPTTPTTIGP
jgi:hypothetical protein